MANRAGRRTASRRAGQWPDDQRPRRVSQHGLTEDDLNPDQLQLGKRERRRNNEGRITITALAGLRPLPATATLAEVIAQQNEICRRLS